MADNVQLNVMAGGDQVAADEISSVKYQRIKLIHGADGVNDGDVAAANPFPIKLYGDAGGGSFTLINVVNTANDNVTPWSGLAVGAAMYGYDGAAMDRLRIVGTGEAKVRLFDQFGNFVDLSAAPQGDGNTSALLGLNVASYNLVFNGSTFDRARGSTTGLQTIGGLAHDVANTAANFPVVAGAETIAHGTNPTAVAAGDVTKVYANRAGVPFVIGGHPNPVTRRDNYTAAQTDTAIVTVSAGTKIVVTRQTVTADKANTVDVAVRTGFAAANTPTGAGVVLSHPGIAAGGGVREGNGGGILGVGADGEDLRITSEVPTSGSIDVVTTYFTIES